MPGNEQRYATHRLQLPDDASGPSPASRPASASTSRPASVLQPTASLSSALNELQLDVHDHHVNYFKLLVVDWMIILWLTHIFYFIIGIWRICGIASTTLWREPTNFIRARNGQAFDTVSRRTTIPWQNTETAKEAEWPIWHQYMLPLWCHDERVTSASATTGFIRFISRVFFYRALNYVTFVQLN